MATANQLIYSIKNLVSPENMSSSNITNELLYFLVDETAVMLKRQDLTKNGNIPSAIIQDLGCIPISQIDRSVCPCTLPWNCVISRTAIPIPKMLQTHSRELITYVGPIDTMGMPFDKIEMQRAKFENYGKFNFTKYFIADTDRYIYLVSKSPILLDYINCKGVLETPSDAATFKKCSGDVCYNNDMEYPLIASQINTLIDIVAKKISVMSQSFVDKTNDQNSNPTSQLTK